MAVYLDPNRRKTFEQEWRATARGKIEFRYWNQAKEMRTKADRLLAEAVTDPLAHESEANGVSFELVRSFLSKVAKPKNAPREITDYITAQQWILAVEAAMTADKWAAFAEYMAWVLLESVYDDDLQLQSKPLPPPKRFAFAAKKTHNESEINALAKVYDRSMGMRNYPHQLHSAFSEMAKLSGEANTAVAYLSEVVKAAFDDFHEELSRLPAGMKHEVGVCHGDFGDVVHCKSCPDCPTRELNRWQYVPSGKSVVKEYREEITNFSNTVRRVAPT